jgi:hypothetical protein
MHHGMAHFVDEPAELWESVSWAPQLGLRRAQIALNPEKMATMAESRKQQVMNLGVDYPLEYLYFFDPHILFIRLLSSEIRRRMHFGFGHFVDNPTEPWHSRAWLASARPTTSGRYAHHRNGDVLSPSDMVLYECSSSIRSTSGEFARYADGSLIFKSDVVNYRCMEPLCSGSIDTEKHYWERSSSGKRFYFGRKIPRCLFVIFPYIRQQEAPRELLGSQTNYVLTFTIKETAPITYKAEQ